MTSKAKRSAIVVLAKKKKKASISPNSAAKAISLNTPGRWGEQKDKVLKNSLKWNDGSQISEILPNTDKTTYESIPSDIDIRLKDKTPT